MQIKDDLKPQTQITVRILFVACAIKSVEDTISQYSLIGIITMNIIVAKGAVILVIGLNIAQSCDCVDAPEVW